jgi:uncharacterized protein
MNAPTSVAAMVTTTRRELIQRTALTGGGLFFLGNLSGLFTGAPSILNGCAPTPGGGHGGGGIGPLVADPAGLLDLPAGFSYRSISVAGDPLPGGGLIPDRFDGTSTFAKGGRTYLVRNHEQGEEADLPAVAALELTYDPASFGGTTTLQIGRDGHVVDEYVSLAGTWNNCAGGLTPWGTWLTCEETETTAGEDGATKDHGFVFEVDPLHPERNVDPTPLTALGRFAHEATMTDPFTGIVYLTEDASGPNGLVYRFLPNKPLRGHGSLRAGGRLQAMRCTDHGTFVPDLSAYGEPGTRLRIGWVDVPDPLAATDSTRVQLSEVTRSRKYEGAWWGRREGFVACSFARGADDGSVGAHDGQVWKLDPSDKTLTLEVHYGINPDYATGDLTDGPDNITVSPWGGLIIAEDGTGAQHLQAVTDDGETLPLARNARDDSEFAGVTFSADRQTLYANLQAPGVTFAITGPFNKIKHGAAA